VTDSLGNVLREESRFPYGLERNVSENTVTADYVYTGKEYDSETGLIYFGGRYYAPELGRWITPDPLFLEKEPAKIVEMPKELNLYAYVQGNPMSAVDRDGAATDFNIGQKPTYIPGRPWSERSPEQRMVETVAMGVVGTVAIAPIAVVAGLAAAPVVGAAYLSTSVGTFGAIANTIGMDNAYKTVTYARQFITGLTPSVSAEGYIGTATALIGLESQVYKYAGTSPARMYLDKLKESPMYLVNPIGAAIEESDIIQRGVESMLNSSVDENSN